MNFIGQVFQNKLGYIYRVVEFVYSDSKNKYYKVKFDDSGYEVVTTKSAIKRTAIKDPFQPSVANIGYIGEMHNQATTKDYIYRIWHNMINRCYLTSSQEFKRYGALGVRVDERWHNFTNFFHDFPLIEGYDEELIKQKQLFLDKDKKQIHLPKEKRTYSLETCMFVTASENNIYADHSERIKRNSLTFVAIKDDLKIETSNAAKFEKEHGLSAGSVSRCLSGKAKQAKGWTFKRI